MPHALTMPNSCSPGCLVSAAWFEHLNSLAVNLLAGCLCTVFFKLFSLLNCKAWHYICRHGVEVGCDYAKVADMLNSKSSTNEAAVAPWTPTAINIVWLMANSERQAWHHHRMNHFSSRRKCIIVDCCHSACKVCILVAPVMLITFRVLAVTV